MDLSRLTPDREVTLRSVLGVSRGGTVIAQGLDREGKPVVVSMTLRLSESVPADLDGNGIVDQLDVRLALELIEHQNPVMDLNGDGSVNNEDLWTVIRSLGQRSTEIEFAQ